MSTYHSIRNSNTIESLVDCCKDSNVYIMNDILNKKIGEPIYSLAFINPYGRHGVNYYYSTLNTKKYIKPHKESLEFYLTKNYSGNYGIIDLQQPFLQNSTFYMKPIFHKYLKSTWAQNYSWVFFIKEMKRLVFKNPFAQ